MKRLFLSILSLVIAFMFCGCATTSGNTPAEKRAAVQNMRQQVLADLYRIKPAVRAEVQSAPGYGVFSDANVNVILASFSGGYGVVRDNRNGNDVYMKMGEAGIGLGWGLKDFRAVLVFHDAATLEQFVSNGWQLGAHADAAAQAGDAGGSVGGEVLLDNITVYQMTESGLALQATIKGTRYWKDDELN